MARLKYNKVAKGTKYHKNMKGIKGVSAKTASLVRQIANIKQAATTVVAKGAMKPKIQQNLQTPTRRTKMSYEGSWNALCNGSLGQVSVPYVFRMNSVFDPDFSNFSRNVRANGWTIANTLYTDYRVHKCKVTLEFINRSDHPVMFCLSANNDISIQSAATYPADILSRAGSFGKLVTQVGSSKASGKITRTYNLWEVEGISQDEYKDSSGTAALLSSNPTDNCYCYATIASYPEASGDTTFGVFRILMEFDVELLNPRDQVATAV